MTKKFKTSKVSKSTLKRTESVVNRKRGTLEISSIQMPNRLEAGLEDLSFRDGFQVYGDTSISGSALLESSAYLNFGDKIGESGYGFRDNDGTIQFRNSPASQATSWTNIGGGGGSGTPANPSTSVQFNNAGSFGGDAKFFWNTASTTLTVGSTGLSGDDGILKVFDTISGSIHHTSDGKSYIVAGSSISVVSESNGQITINAQTTPLTVASGSISVSNVSTLAASDGIIVVNEGSGRAALSASIGVPEDGSYTDGLFTDFTPQTRLGIAIDRFNEVLKGLAPGAAPGLDNMDSNNYGASAKLSFGSSQSISGYTNVNYTGLSPSTSLSSVDINGSYVSITPTDNDIRAACFNGSTTVEGTLNEDITADGVNYPEHAFGNGDQGTLSLFVNNNSSAIHTVDLSSFGSGNSLNGNGSGFINLSTANPAHFPDGSNFDTFKHRTGDFRVHTADQRNGWNYARVVHTIGASSTTTKYVEWVNDPNSNALSADSSSGGVAMDTLNMTGLFRLSGVHYHTGGTAQYRARVLNAYRNVYSPNNITFTGTRCGIPDQSFPSINHAGGEDETKKLHITGSATINTDPILNNTIGASVNVPHPLKSDLSSAGSQTISGIFLYNLSNTSTVTSETFRRENYRIKSGSYDTQSSVTNASNTWDSTTSLATVDGLLFYNSALRAPVQGGASGDFRNTSDGGSIANGPSSNVNYSSITSGLRTFYRYFQNNSGGAKTDFSLAINGSGTIVSQGTSLGTGNISVLAKIPTTGNSQSTGWMDLAVPFATGQTGNGDGCLNGSFDSSLNATNAATFGTAFVDSNEYIVIKIEADAAFTGNISTITLTWS